MQLTEGAHKYTYKKSQRFFKPKRSKVVSFKLSHLFKQKLRRIKQKQNRMVYTWLWVSAILYHNLHVYLDIFCLKSSRIFFVAYKMYLKENFLLSWNGESISNLIETRRTTKGNYFMCVSKQKQIIILCGRRKKFICA